MGAWIEIFVPILISVPSLYVAPHDGCVDWNLKPLDEVLKNQESHPTMGAWIEIS